ncbi:hypothetical protein HAX54_047214, partial [Datura stramonium]|nr:hypothetical protein [Datura stramonium]
QEAEVDKEMGQVWCSAMEAMARYHRESSLPRVEFMSNSSGGARYLCGTELMLRDTLRAMLRVIYGICYVWLENGGFASQKYVM